ncbi:MAG: amidohydrolase family protein [Anaerolineae bacterium]
MMVIEWSEHLFTYWRDWFPFSPRAPYEPDPESLSRHPVQDYLLTLEQRHIDQAIIVQPEPYGDDHRLVLYALALEQSKLKASCLFLPSDPLAVDKLECLVGAEPRIIALRFHAFRGRRPYFPDWNDGGVQRLWRRAGELGLAIELHISPDQADGLVHTLDHMPPYPVIIDHLAEPGLGSAQDFLEVLTLARYPHVWIKLSALERLRNELGGDRALKELVGRVADRFGPRRLVWGGGAPEQLVTLFDMFTSDERSLVTGENLARLLKEKRNG